MLRLLVFTSNWWPMFVLVFYALSPVPTLIARRFADSVEMSSVLIEICVFITSCIVVSAYGLPLVLARAGEVVRLAHLLARYGQLACILPTHNPVLRETGWVPDLWSAQVSFVTKLKHDVHLLSKLFCFLKFCENVEPLLHSRFQKCIFSQQSPLELLSIVNIWT